FVERLCLYIEILRLKAHLYARGLAFDRKHRRTGHYRRQRLRAAHSAEAGCQDPPAGKRTAVMAPPQLRKRLVGALNDSLTADVDPAARRHLAVHHQALAVEQVEMVP